VFSATSEFDAIKVLNLSEPVSVRRRRKEGEEGGREKRGFRHKHTHTYIQME
jgi:hypothetical protein